MERGRLTQTHGGRLDIGIRVRNLGDGQSQAMHGSGIADDPWTRLALHRELFAQAPVLDGQRTLVERAGHDIDQVLHRERLFDEIVGSGAHRLDRHADVAMSGDEDDRSRAVVVRRPVHARRLLRPRPGCTPPSGETI
jgi:hypothetical protein